MTFDIHQLDALGWDDYDQAFEEYRDSLLECFFESPEGRSHLQEFPEAGFWASQLMCYGYGYLGVTLPEMTKRHVQEIVTELFPRKISLLSPDDADGAIPELTAFWKYLEREYGLRQAGAILRFLHKIAPDFERVMNDPSKFGMAKSFAMMGQQAGFDMTKKEDIDAFVHLYNASILAQDSEPLAGPRGTGMGRKARAKRKRKRRAARAARKRNRKR